MNLLEFFWKGWDRRQMWRSWAGTGTRKKLFRAGFFVGKTQAACAMGKRKDGQIAGFTLIEVLVVVAIIAVLAVMISIAAGKVRSMTERSVCASNLRQIGLAAQSYAQDNNGAYPLSYDMRLGVNAGAPGLIDRLGPYVGSESEWKIFYCPDAEHCVPPPGLVDSMTYNYQLAQTGKDRFFLIGYFWLVSSSGQWRPENPVPPIKTIGSSQRVLAVCPHFGGGVVHNRLQNMLFSDGRVETRQAKAYGGIISDLNQQNTADGQEALTFRNP